MFAENAPMFAECAVDRMQIRAPETTAVESVQIVQVSPLSLEWMQELHLTTVVKEELSFHCALPLSFPPPPVVLLSST